MGYFADAAGIEYSLHLEGELELESSKPEIVLIIMDSTGIMRRFVLPQRILARMLPAAVER